MKTLYASAAVMALLAPSVQSVRLDSVYVPASGIYLQMEYPQFAKVKPHRRRIIDEDGDGVEDNQKIDRYELDRFYKPRVFGVAVEDLHNTHNGELPGHHRFGEGHEPGKDPWAEARAKEAAAAAEKEKQKGLAAKSTDVQLESSLVQFETYADARSENEYDSEAIETNAEVNQWEAGTPRKRRIIDADGDGVEDN
jgi:hypothetical protein